MLKEIRTAYGEALVKYGKDDDRVVVLDADVSSSTKSALFAKAFPERFFNVGIAEANMAAMAAGLSTTGKIPFVNTFAVFMTTIGLLSARSLVAYTKLNVKFAGAYGGLSDSFDGPSHHSFEDIAIMRLLPNFKVAVASDAVLTDWLVKNAIENPGPEYIRLSRGAMPDLYPSDAKFEYGRGNCLADGSDVTIIACGIMVGFALSARDILLKEGICARVVDMFTIKPLDKVLVLECAMETGAVVTAEEHSIVGGLGGAIAELLSENAAGIPHEFVGVRDCFTECGAYHALLGKYGLDTSAIVAACRRAVARKTSK